MKKLLISIFTIASCMLFVTNSHAVVDDTTCTVSNSQDNSSFGSLRRKLDQGYNRPSNRFCMNEINFSSGGNFEIKLGSTLNIVGSGALNITKKEAASVKIDGTELGEDDCVLNLKDATDTQNSVLTLSNITLLAKKRAKAVCGNLAAGSTVTIIAEDDQCNASHGQCCDAANGRWKDAGTSCDDGSSSTVNDQCNSNHECSGTTQACTPGSTCCTAEGQWAAEGASCEDGNANTTNDVCSASHQCAGTAIVPECTAGDECCDNTGHWSPAGTPCTTGGEAGTCSAAHTCDMVTPPVCGNNIVETGEQCDDGNSTAGDGCNNCQTEVPPATDCVADSECCDSTGHWVADGTSCDDGDANTNNDVCNAHNCAGTPGGGTVTPPGGSTTPPPGGSTTPPDNSNTTPINLGGSGGGCMLTGSLNSMAAFWMMILGLMPMVMVRRKK